MALPQSGMPAPTVASRYYTYRQNVPGQVGFTAGKGYYSRGPAASRPGRADPFSQLSATQIRQIVGRYSGGYGTPMNDSQIQSAAQAQIDPIIAAVTKNINDSATQRASAITANSQALADSLKNFDFGAAYAPAIKDQAAVDAVLHSALQGGGANVANDLSARLASIGEPGAVHDAASAVAAQGAGAANANLASGSASLSNLLAQAAAAKEYGAKQPGIAALAGLQDVAAVNRDAQQQIADQTTSILSKLPDIVASLRNENQNVRSNRAQAAQQLFQFLTGQNASRANAKMNHDLAVAAGLLNDYKAHQEAAHQQRSDQTASARAAEQQRHNQQSEAAASQRNATSSARAAEQRRHDRATEKNKGKGSAAPPWSK